MCNMPIAACVLALCAILGAPRAAAGEAFYQGKRLSLVINFAAGGPTDIEGRLFAKHLVKHLESNPSIVVQNMDGAGGMVGAGYLGEVAPRDGTTLGYFTGSAWRYANNPERFRVDFRSYEFVAYQPGTSVTYMRTDVPPGMRKATDIVRAKGLVAGGLGAENSKDLMLRLGLDMLGVPYKYVTSYRGSRHPVYQPLWSVGLHSGRFGQNSGRSRSRLAKQVEGLALLSFPELYKATHGAPPSGQFWNAYRTVVSINTAMQRQIVLPPGAPQAALAVLRTAVSRLNEDKEHAEEAIRTIGYVPEWVAGPDTNREVRTAITIAPEMRAFLADYIKRATR